MSFERIHYTDPKEMLEHLLDQEKQFYETEESFKLMRKQYEGKNHHYITRMVDCIIRLTNNSKILNKTSLSKDKKCLHYNVICDHMLMFLTEDDYLKATQILEDNHGIKIKDLKVEQIFNCDRHIVISFDRILF